MNAPLPRVLYDMPNADYHAADGLSNTGLKQFAKSPYHYWAHKLAPNRPPEPVRAGQLEGELCHCATLEPDEFLKRYVALPEDAPRKPTEAQWKAKSPSADSQAAMDWWRQWNADNDGKQVITAQQYEVAMRQSESVRSLTELSQVFSKGFAEASMFAPDPEYPSVLLKDRPDWTYVPNDTDLLIVDLKTYSSADPREFKLQIARKGYYRQDAHYTKTTEAATGRRVLAFIFVAVETEWPYAASAVMLDDESREIAAAEVAMLTARFAACQESNEWPGYSSGIEVVSLPKYIKAEL